MIYRIFLHFFLYWQVFSALAAFRLLKFLYRKLLYLCGIVGANPGRFSDTVWRRAELSAAPTGLTEQDIKARVLILLCVKKCFAKMYFLAKKCFLFLAINIFFSLKNTVFFSQSFYFTELMESNGQKKWHKFCRKKIVFENYFL
jgi:hypothetical protein